MTLLPVVENSDGSTLGNHVPFANTAFGRCVNEGFDTVLWVHNLYVWQFADVVSETANLQLHGFKILDGGQPK